VGESAVIYQILELAAIDAVLDGPVESGLNLRLLAIADRLDKEFSQGLAFELELAKDIEDLAAQGLPGLFEFFEETPIDIALARLFSDEVP
jgi:hypothetical protein